jgi:hypothetical protein
MAKLNLCGTTLEIRPLSSESSLIRFGSYLISKKLPILEGSPRIERQSARGSRMRGFIAELGAQGSYGNGFRKYLRQFGNSVIM